MTSTRKITTYPTNWPRDNRSHVTERDDVTILTHPDRAPHKYDPVTKKWRLL